MLNGKVLLEQSCKLIKTLGLAISSHEGEGQADMHKPNLHVPPLSYIFSSTIICKLYSYSPYFLGNLKL